MYINLYNDQSYHLGKGKLCSDFKENMMHLGMALKLSESRGIIRTTTKREIKNDFINITSSSCLETNFTLLTTSGRQFKINLGKFIINESTCVDEIILGEKFLDKNNVIDSGSNSIRFREIKFREGCVRIYK